MIHQAKLEEPMRRSNLILLLVLGVDLLLMGIMVFLLIGIRDGTIATAIEQDLAANRITTVLGGAAGVFTAVGLLAFLAQRFNKN
jgi:nitrate reductase gamma subunit